MACLQKACIIFIYEKCNLSAAFLQARRKCSPIACGMLWHAWGAYDKTKKTSHGQLLITDLGQAVEAT